MSVPCVRVVNVSCVRARCWVKRKVSEPTGTPGACQCDGRVRSGERGIQLCRPIGMLGHVSLANGCSVVSDS